MAVQAGNEHPIIEKLRGVATVGGPYAEAQSDTITTILGTLVYWFLSLLGVIFLAFMIYAGYLWLTAHGNSEQVEKSKSIIKESIIGLTIVLSAAAITSLIYLAFV